jgi:hypothetical protein
MFACGPLWEAALLVLDRGSAGDVFIVKFLDDLGEIHLVHRLVKSDENVREWHAALLVLDRASAGDVFIIKFLDDLGEIHPEDVPGVGDVDDLISGLEVMFIAAATYVKCKSGSRPVISSLSHALAQPRR